MQMGSENWLSSALRPPKKAPPPLTQNYFLQFVELQEQMAGEAKSWWIRVWLYLICHSVWDEAVLTIRMMWHHCRDLPFSSAVKKFVSRLQADPVLRSEWKLEEIAQEASKTRIIDTTGNM
jgi:hypothetical protein